MNLEESKIVFFHGIAGTGMRGLAWLLREKGKEVRGTDTTPEAIVELSSQFTVAPEGEASDLLDHVDIYIHSDAVLASHPLRQEALARGIAILSYQSALGEFTDDYTLVAVTGTHGKSSTTAFLAHILQQAGKDPSALVGAGVTSWPGKHARFGKSKIFVVEADEYRNHFHELHPTYAVIPTIEYDHPDFFKSEADVWKSYQTFIDRIPPQGWVVIPKTLQDTPMTWPPSTVVVDTSAAAPHVSIPGKHMQANAALALKAALLLGVSADTATQALATFPGLTRRFEQIGMLGRLSVISDYAHHPTEIAATLAAVKETYPGKKIVVIFEAHMAERMEAFNDEFARALSIADAIILYPPYLPEGRQGVESNQLRDELAEKIQEHHVPLTVLQEPIELPGALEKYASTHEIAIACTAGRLDMHIRQLVS